MRIEEGSPVQALVVDDAPEFVEILVAALRTDGFDVRVATSGEDAIVSARAVTPDVIVLDIGLPGIDGLETCRRLREFTDAYIVMLTARDDEVDKVLALTVGADDYMTKPFSPRELVARVRAMLRRPRTGAVMAADTARRAFGDLIVDPAARAVTASDVAIELTKIEFDLLDALSGHPDRVLTRGQLIELVWGDDWFGDDHVIDVHMSKLRRKLGDAGRAHVVTLRGVGYRFVSDPAHQAAS
jgi:DNA-binding response OmpR family regulator